MRETAEAIGISLAAAKRRLFHARIALRKSLIPKLVHQSRFANRFVFCPKGHGSRKTNARTRSNDQKQSNHKEKGDEYVIETKERWNIEPQAISTQPETGEVSVGNSAHDEEVRRRAYEIYRERGEQPGHDLDDWLQAERELEGRVLRSAQAG